MIFPNVHSRAATKLEPRYCGIYLQYRMSPPLENGDRVRISLHTIAEELNYGQNEPPEATRPPSPKKIGRRDAIGRSLRRS